MTSYSALNTHEKVRRKKTEMTRANESNLIFIWGLKKKRDWIVGRILCTSTKDEKTTAISQGLTGFLKRGRKWDRTGIKRNVSRRLRYTDGERFWLQELDGRRSPIPMKCLLANWKSSKLGELRLLRECISLSRALLFIYLFFYLKDICYLNRFLSSRYWLSSNWVEKRNQKFSFHKRYQ